MGATCTTIQVVSGDSCASLASKCGISPANFTAYNPSPTLCSSLTPGQHVCCSSGSLPDYTPTPYPNGTCSSWLVQPGDYCAYLAAEFSITVDEIEAYNNNTWGWLGCSDLQVGQNICMSLGNPPFPSPVSGTVCGPQVPGTTPTNNSAGWALLNPCPLNACCDIWGQCGTTPDFCTASKSVTGAPGTSAPGTSGCISNCGVNITNNADPPAEFFNIGCLTLDANRIPSSYSHVHFAFANITADFQVDVFQLNDTFIQFARQTEFKRILSFGDSYPIFRQGVTAADRQTFANSIASFVSQYDLDGVDFDWEYPGSPEDGTNYLAFLQTLRSVLPAGKTISMAAPASYWYLRGFPIKDMVTVLDYITVYALAMITKAGVPADKVVVGVSSYGKSFSIVDPSCTGPEYLFTGPESSALPGNCITTTGYIADVEIYQYIESSTESWHDNSSDLDITVYGSNTWVAYMGQATKNSRISLYNSYNFGGSVEWAIDLKQFSDDNSAERDRLSYQTDEVDWM
ncbi:class V chitinase-like protein [Xylogone sp. PMI_703]|nr:class V chitinase-like protein [Xylogone sp. PMI_703]